MPATQRTERGEKEGYTSKQVNVKCFVFAIVLINQHNKTVMINYINGLMLLLHTCTVTIFVFSKSKRKIKQCSTVYENELQYMVTD